ncbi:MAG: hypothetical protein J7L69_10025 [Desulfobulbaceae bacterium]|nr:hypothetical protein [Desulfobulbaceae bacterium]
MTISQQTIEIVKSTAPLLKEKGEDVTARMYPILFSKYPETEVLFKNANNQPAKLATAIAAYAANIDQLENLGDAVERMAQRHVNVKVKPKHYPMVADALLTAMTEVLGSDVVTDEVSSAWGEAFNFLADILKTREKELYAA